jgi:hypothetical protein
MRSDVDEEGIARMAAVGIVYRLETVEIEEERGETSASRSMASSQAQRSPIACFLINQSDCRGRLCRAAASADSLRTGLEHHDASLRRETAVRARLNASGC